MAAALRRVGLADLRAQSGAPAEALASLKPRFEALAARLAEELAPLTGPALKLTVDTIEKTAAVAEAYDSDLYWINARIVADRDGIALTARLDRNFLFAACEAAFGGAGTGKPFAEERPFSNIEKKLAAAILARLAQALPAAFAETSCAQVTFAVEEAKEPAATAAEAKFLLNALGYNGDMVIGIDKDALEMLKGDAAAKRPAAAPMPKRDWSPRARAQLNNVDIDLTVVMAELEIDLRELSSLHVGKLIKLPVRLDSAMKVYCQGAHLFDASFARSGTAYTICIDRMSA
jgi:flagellar motor switch protein FliM